MNFEEAYTEDSSKHRDYFPIYNEIFSNNGIDRNENYKIYKSVMINDTF